MTNTDDITRAFTALSDTRERNAYVVALRQRGWTLDQVASVSSLSRVDVRRIESTTPKDDALQVALDLVTRGVPLPDASSTRPPVPRPAPRGAAPEPTPRTLNRLRELKPLAEKVRSSSPRYRKEAEEYSALLDYAIKVEGTTVYRLAKLLGVTHGALYFRLTRYGYRPAPSEDVSPATKHIYKQINPNNRYKGE